MSIIRVDAVVIHLVVIGLMLYIITYRICNHFLSGCFISDVLDINGDITY